MRIRNPLGIAPINGPKNGMIFVTPTITAIRCGYGRPRISMAIKHKIPMIAESRIRPLMNPLNMRFACWLTSITALARSFLRQA